MTVRNPGTGAGVSAVLSADLGAISAQTALQNVTGLGLTIGASATEIWRVTYWLIVTGANATMDLKVGFSVPAGCTMRGGSLTAAFGGWAPVAVASSPLSVSTESTVLVIGTGAANQFGVALNYIAFGGGTGGTVQIQYAQNTSDAGNLQVLKGSAMEALKLAT